jgi:hypothetical protein
MCKLTVTVCPCQSINVVDLGKRVLEEAVTAPPPKKSKAEKKVVPPPKVEESSEESDEEEVVCAADKCFLVLIMGFSLLLLSVHAEIHKLTYFVIVSCLMCIWLVILCSHQSLWSSQW